MEEGKSKRKGWVETTNAFFEYLIDDILMEHTGCVIAALIVGGFLLVFLLLGVTFYDSYIHRNQHCVIAHQEYILVGHVLTQEDVCDTWQNN